MAHTIAPSIDAPLAPRSPGAGFASFDDDWCPARYLADYYGEVQPDEQVTMRFLADAAAFVGPVPRLLEFGCGPTVHHLLAFAPTAGEMHVADYLRSNLDAVRRWVRGHDGAHDWSSFARFVVEHELARPAQRVEVAEREALTHDRIVAYHLADVRRALPLDAERHVARWSAVLCCFCPDSITDDLDEWRRYTGHVASLVEPGGWLVIAALRDATSYRVGDHRFPSAGVMEADVATVLADAGFSRLGTTIVAAPVPDTGRHGFDSVVLAVSRKPCPRR